VYILEWKKLPWSCRYISLMHKLMYPSYQEFLELLLRQLYHNFLHIIIIIITHECMASENFLYILWGLGRSKGMKIVWQLLLWAVCKMSEHLLLQHGIQLVLTLWTTFKWVLSCGRMSSSLSCWGVCSSSCYFEVLDKNSLHVLCCYVI